MGGGTTEQPSIPPDSHLEDSPLLPASGYELLLLEEIQESISFAKHHLRVLSMKVPYLSITTSQLWDRGKVTYHVGTSVSPSMKWESEQYLHYRESEN